jgi:hypothetical protein
VLLVFGLNVCFEWKLTSGRRLGEEVCANVRKVVLLSKQSCQVEAVADGMRIRGVPLPSQGMGPLFRSELHLSTETCNSTVTT